MAPSSDVEHLNETLIFEQAILNCTIPRELYFTRPIVGELHAHDLMTLIAGVCLIITFLFSLGTSIQHLRNYTVPREQRQIVRILWTPFVFGNSYFFSLWFYPTQTYLITVADLYEIFGLVAIYLLFLAYVCPEHEEYESFFANFERPKKKKKQSSEQSTGGGSLLWFTLLSLGIVQIFPGHIATAIATWVTTATECPLSPALLHNNLIIKVISGVLLAIMVMCVVQIYRALRPNLQGRKAGTKLTMFKVMVIIAQTQPIIFTSLAESGHLTPTHHMSALDYVYGLPDFLTCCEMAIFSVVFAFLFSAKEYKHARPAALMESTDGRKPERMGYWHAVLHVINYWDVVKRTWIVFTFEGYRREKRREKEVNIHSEGLKLTDGYEMEAI